MNFDALRISLTPEHHVQAQQVHFRAVHASRWPCDAEGQNGQPQGHHQSGMFEVPMHFRFFLRLFACEALSIEGN